MQANSLVLFGGISYIYIHSVSSSGSLSLRFVSRESRDEFCFQCIQTPNNAVGKFIVEIVKMQLLRNGNVEIRK